MPWYRTITPTSELKTLSMRDKLTDDEVNSQRIRCVRDYDSVINQFPGNFTPVSAFQYILSDVKQHIFKKPLIGILVLPREEKSRKVIWRNSLRNGVSDSIFKKYLTLSTFNERLTDNGFEYADERAVRLKIKEAFQQLQRQYKKEKFDPAEAMLPWTEGLFRYKTKEIFGIVINPDDVQSCKIGYAFACVVCKINKIQNINFYKLNENNYPEKISFKPILPLIFANEEEVRDLVSQFRQSYFN